MTYKTHPTLYTKDNLGKIRLWFVEQFDHQYQSVSGIVGGNLVTSGITTARGNAQRPDAIEQATFEIEADYRKKRERGYYDDINNIGPVPFFEPMLAQKYDAKKVWASAESVYTQPKLDGIRCIAKVDGLWSRKGKPILSVPSIFEALRPAFDADPSAVFDGELYNHDFKDDFNQITSLVRKGEPLPADKQALVQYHIYDDATDPLAPFGQRAVNLPRKLQFGDQLRLVPTNQATTPRDLDDLYGLYLEDGYEGQMVRLDGPYEIGSRSKLLLKRKEFQDAEYPIVEIVEGNGNWSGYAKRVTLRLPDGRLFGAGIKGNQKQALELLQNKDSYVSKLATVRFFNLTPDGIPRFPVVVDFTRED